jgi:hypothetical protein
MVHSGYEATAVHDTFNSLSGFIATVRATLFSKYPDRTALADLNNPVQPAAPHTLVQLGAKREDSKEVEV